MAAIPVIIVLHLVLHLWVSSQAQATFVFPRLAGLTSGNLSALYLNGNAVTQPDLIGIRLTNQSEYVTGTVLYSEPVRMKERGSKNATLSFSTSFVFAMAPPDPSQCAEGLSFIITPNKTHEGGLPGSYLGLFNFTSMGQPYNHLFAVEFDIFQNAEFNDINDNHIGLNLNSLSSLESNSAGYWDGNNQFLHLDLNGRQNIQAWIDYDHLQQQLNVTIAPAGSLRPEKPLISKKNMSLSDIFEEEMYVGFVAATGKLVQEHYILAWSFTTNGTAPALNASILPILTAVESHSNKPKSALIVGITAALVGFLVFMVAVVWFKRVKSRDNIEEWEEEYWPHRISYRDLAIATKRFGEKQVLGSGGFGKVYKGILPTNGLEIAVKAIFRETTEGVKEFIAEISSLGRLQHRNLVQIRGYCRRGKKLFIVYDFMLNGSMDKMIFGSPSRLLGWSQRYSILRDVAAGLLYLHEGWEQRVVHRDIKSSNVLLDSELRGKLGDFGLARLYRHDENSQTTHVAGTPGYIAPDLISTGRASSSTDIFSFGILLLEVACGRRPVEGGLMDPSQIILLDWVRELYASDRLMDAADSKLGGDFAEDEMETVLKLGLFCSNPRPEGRPNMRQVVQILEGEASLAASALPLSFEMSESGPIEDPPELFRSMSMEVPLNGSLV